MCIVRQDGHEVVARNYSLEDCQEKVQCGAWEEFQFAGRTNEPTLGTMPTRPGVAAGMTTASGNSYVAHHVVPTYTKD